MPASTSGYRRDSRRNVFPGLDYIARRAALSPCDHIPETMVQDEVMLVSLHALRGIMIVRKDYEEAKQLELRAAAYEAAHPECAVTAEEGETRSRSR